MGLYRGSPPRDLGLNPAVMSVWEVKVGTWVRGSVFPLNTEGPASHKLVHKLGVDMVRTSITCSCTNMG